MSYEIKVGTENFDPNRLQLGNGGLLQSKRSKVIPKPKSNGKLLKGPIPWDWIARAARQPGRTLAVGMTLWLWAGMKRSRQITLSVSALADVGVQRNAAYRALKAMEQAGLISVIRHVGRKPKVTLLDAPQD